MWEHGWTLREIRYADEKGDDIVATRGAQRLRVEAKGEGSSKAGSARHGRPFNDGQVFTHVSVAVGRAMVWTSNGSDLAAVALPDNDGHARRMDLIRPSLQRLEIGIFWVDLAGACRWEGTPEVLTPG